MFLVAIRNSEESWVWKRVILSKMVWDMFGREFDVEIYGEDWIENGFEIIKIIIS